jgi:predicted ATPase/DNA-binding SARP family transcriptional activator
MGTYVRLFGAPAVECDGRVLALHPERRHELAAWLALRAAPVSRDQLAALFWPERDNATARRNLRRLAFDVRAFDWTEGLTADRATLAWPVATDVADFERALAATRLDDALALYRGPLCEGLEDANNNAFAEALRLERARLAERWRAAVLARIDRATDAQAKLALALRMLAADPIDEEALVVALEAHSALGRAGQAQRLYREFKERLAEALGIEPGARLRELARRLEAGGDAKIAPVAAGAGFVGRAKELAELQALIGRTECRLLTITGPGGIGKSRLAKTAIGALEPRFAGGIGWIPLDDLTDTAHVAPRIAQLLGVELTEREDPLACVTRHLAQRDVLLVLDNAERLHAITATIGRLLAAAPRLKLLATSRRRLGASGEWLLPLAGLPVPAQDDAETDAVRLFELRARAADPSFVAARTGRDVARLVRALGGLPLAIELAAHWVRLLPPAELLAEVQNSLDVLAREEEGDERPEHRSVRATFEQSWHLLAPAEQQTLAALSVFAGSLTRAAAREAAGASLLLLAALADKSLVQAGAGGRFSLHPLLARFAREKLRAAGDEARVLRAHAEWYLRLLAERRQAVQDGRREALDEVERDFENIRLAWQYAVAAHATDWLADAAAPLMYFLQIRMRSIEGAALLEQAAAALDAERASDRKAVAEVLRALAQLQYRLGRLDPAIDNTRRALRLFRHLGSREGIKRCLGVLGLALWQTGAYPDAKRCFEDGLRRALAEGDAHGVATFTGNVGLIEKALGNYERALALYREALERNRQIGDLVGVGNQYVNLGNLYRLRREWDSARRTYEEGLAFAEAHGHARGLPWFYINLALTCVETGERERGAELNRRALALAREGGYRQIETQALLLAARLALARADTATARACVRDALKGACAMGHVPIQLDCIAWHGRVLAVEGDLAGAASLWTYVMQQARLDAADRRELAQLLAEVPADVRAEPPSMPVAELGQRILAEAARPHASPA